MTTISSQLEGKPYNRISVIGLGYVGLPTAATFASRKHQVIGVDVSQKVVDKINAGEIHITEPDLDIVVRAVVSEGFLRASTKAEPADAFLIAVPTPFKGNDHEPDLSYVRAAAEAVAEVLAPGNLVVLESTSPVGATEQMADWMAAARPDLTFPQTHGSSSDIRIAHCPERILPGSVLRELVENDRVIGGMTPACAEGAKALYRSFVAGNCVVTNARTAEMAKLTENSFRDLNIAFANELSMVCEDININVWELIELSNLHPRVNILRPGPGVGGHCIAVDPWFIVSGNPERATLIRTAREVNDIKPQWVVDKVHRRVEALKTPVIACLGLAYKPDVDDLRESPSVEVVSKLAQSGAGSVLVVEPHLDTLPKELEGTGAQMVSLDAALERANTIVVLVNHKQFKYIDKETLKEKILIDICGSF